MEGFLWALTHWANGHGWKNWVQAAGRAVVCGQHCPAWARGKLPASPLACVLGTSDLTMDHLSYLYLLTSQLDFVFLLTPRALMQGSTGVA